MTNAGANVLLWNYINPAAMSDRHGCEPIIRAVHVATSKAPEECDSYDAAYAPTWTIIWTTGTLYGYGAGSQRSSCAARLRHALLSAQNGHSAADVKFVWASVSQHWLFSWCLGQ